MQILLCIMIIKQISIRRITLNINLSIDDTKILNITNIFMKFNTFQVYMLDFIDYQDRSKIKALARREKSNWIIENHYFLYYIAILFIFTLSSIQTIRSFKMKLTK